MAQHVDGNGHRLGGVVDRELVQERLAARAAALPALAPAATLRVAANAMPTVLTEEVDVNRIERTQSGLAHAAFVARAVLDATHGALEVGGAVLQGARDLRLRALADRLGDGATTFTVPELGGATLSVGPARDKPVSVDVDGERGIAVRPVVTLALASDGRAEGAAFLARVREVLEHHDWSAEL